MTKLFNFPFSAHSFASTIKQLYIREMFGRVSFGVFGAFPRRMLLCTLVNILSVARVETAVDTFENVNVEQPAV
jgi:uncharacterized protein YbcI